MKVSELIEALKAHNPDALVLTPDIETAVSVAQEFPDSDPPEVFAAVDGVEAGWCHPYDAEITSDISFGTHHNDGDAPVVRLRRYTSEGK